MNHYGRGKGTIIFIILSFILLILVGASLFLGTIVRFAVENVAEKSLQVAVSLGPCTLSPISGNGTLHRFKVANPDGFTTDYAMKLGSIKVQLQPKSLMHEVITINEVRIEDPVINFETNALGSNLDVLRKNAAASAAQSAKSDKKVIIRSLFIQGAKLQWSPRLLSKEEFALVLPDIHIRNIGTEQGGSELAQVYERVLIEIVNMSVRIIQAQGTQLVSGAVKGGVGTAGGILDVLTAPLK